MAKLSTIVCKQCGKVVTSYADLHDMCPDCIKISKYAYTALAKSDAYSLRMLHKYFTVLQQLGYEPFTVHAKHILSIDVASLPNVRKSYKTALESLLFRSMNSIGR